MNEEHVIASIEDLFYGRLPPERAAMVSSHVKSCARCERAFERWASAERALFEKREWTPFAEDRVADRLFGAPPPKPRRAPAFIGVFVTATALAAAAIVGLPRIQTDEFAPRSGSGTHLAPEVKLRALRVRAPEVADLSGGGELARGDRLRLFFDAGAAHRYASASIVAENGRVLEHLAPAEIEAGATDRPLGGGFTAGDDWPIGQVTIVLRLSATPAPAGRRFDERAYDAETDAVRIARVRVVEAP
jgi:hypothetical protein